MRNKFRVVGALMWLTLVSPLLLFSCLAFTRIEDFLLIIQEEWLHIGDMWHDSGKAPHTDIYLPIALVFLAILASPFLLIKGIFTLTLGWKKKE